MIALLSLPAFALDLPAEVGPALESAEVVGVGVAAWESAWFSAARTDLVLALVERAGVREIGFEVSWLDVLPASRYVATCAGELSTATRSLGRTDAETARLLAALCAHNTAHPGDPVTLFGFDAASAFDLLQVMQAQQLATDDLQVCPSYLNTPKKCLAAVERRLETATDQEAWLLARLRGRADIDAQKGARASHAARSKQLAENVRLFRTAGKKAAIIGQARLVARAFDESGDPNAHESIPEFLDGPYVALVVTGPLEAPLHYGHAASDASGGKASNEVFWARRQKEPLAWHPTSDRSSTAPTDGVQLIASRSFDAALVVKEPSYPAHLEGYPERMRQERSLRDAERLDHFTLIGTIATDRRQLVLREGTLTLDPEQVPQQWAGLEARVDCHRPQGGEVECGSPWRTPAY